MKICDENGYVTTDGVIGCILISILMLLLIVALFWGGAALHAKYNIWHQKQVGEATLAEATYSKQVAVQEAKAKMGAAKLLAQAEVERAKGVAKANQIIGGSLKNNEAYLRYLWINNLHEGKNQIVYVTTEANLPILEATRLKNENKGTKKKQA